MIDEILDFLAGVQEWFEDRFSWLSDAFGWMGDLAEGSPVIGNIWFWLFFAALMFGVWMGPGMFGVKDYSFFEKLMYTVVFFVLDYMIMSRMVD